MANLEWQINIIPGACPWAVEGSWSTRGEPTQTQGEHKQVVKALLIETAN